MPVIDRINAALSTFADGGKIRYLNINSKFADDGMLDPRDKLHLTVRAYQVWADALRPIFTELLGPPKSS
jgi:lysophospholipase L1-like esterase